MFSGVSRIAALSGSTFLAAFTIGAACMRESSARPAQAGGVVVAVVADDTALIVRLLTAVRGVNPLLCELATRNVDMHASWSHWGPLGGNPLEVDSAAAALLQWIQRDHNDPSVVPHLRSAMRDVDACVRRVAGSFLGRVDHASARDALLAALDDPNAETRYVAALGIGLSEKPAGVAVLVRRLKDESAAVRRASAWALGSQEASTALTSLIETLEHDSDPRVRQAAAWAIGNMHE